MNVNIVKIGNSQGIRIPKKVLEQTIIKDSAILKVENGRIIIEPYELTTRDLMLISEASLSKDWDTPEEDAAWAHLQ